MRLAREASLLGASRIAAITPYYLAASPAEVTEYYLRIREAAPEPGLYAYIFPERTGLTVAPQQFCELADAVGLAGAKFSGVAARNVAECAAARITGAAVTPFVLERVERQTAGASVPANLALAENNARVAALVATALAPV